MPFFWQKAKILDHWFSQTCQFWPFRSEIAHFSNKFEFENAQFCPKISVSVPRNTVGHLISACDHVIEISRGQMSWFQLHPPSTGYPGISPYPGQSVIPRGLTNETLIVLKRSCLFVYFSSFLNNLPISTHIRTPFRSLFRHEQTRPNTKNKQLNFRF